MNRRTFVAAVGVGVIAAAPKAPAQQLPKVRRIGWILSVSRAAAAGATNALVEGLRDLGWIEGSNLEIVFRSAENHPDLYDKLARDLVALNVDLIVTSGVEAVTAAKNATSRSQS